LLSSYKDINKTNITNNNKGKTNMTYKVSDIIRSAKQIADLENSSFVSWNEDIRLINESWTTIHQKLINSGNMTFTNEISICNEQYLPEDFYQVLSVLDNYDTPVPRYSIGMNHSQIWYKLVNNKIVLNGLSSAKLTYYTKPQFLTFSAETIVDALPLAEGEVVKFAYSNYVLTNKNVWDVKEATIVKALEEDDESLYVDGLGKTYDINNKPIFHSDGTTWSLTENGCTDVHCKVPYSVDIENITFDGVYYYYVKMNDGQILVYEKDSSEVATTYEGYDSNIYFNNEHLFYIKDGVAYVDEIPMYSALNVYNNELYMLKIDLNTGYGIFTNNNRILSIAVDTVLELPNNLYFNVLAYQLAFAYCCKQGKDPTLVSAQLASNMETLYDTLSNDAFSQTKITNVYRGMR
jgi:hypothetical protein